MTTSEIANILIGIVTAINTLVIAYLALKKGKPEVKKLELEGDSEIVDAAHSNLEGAEISQNMLIQRIEELKNDIQEEKKARKIDADYFRRRIRDMDKELRDYRSWAARLAKQVIERGGTPVPFISSLNETDPLIDLLDKERDELKAAKTTREEEIKVMQENKEKP